jgi:hypothetical protein
MSMLTLTEVSKVTGLPIHTVRRRADRIWKDYVTRDGSNRRLFTRMPPTTLRAADSETAPDRPSAARSRPRAETITFHDDDAEPNEKSAAPRIDAASILRNSQPVSQMDWALHWQAKGLVLFPCTKFLGDPLLPNWYAPANKFGTGGATNGEASVISWWTQWPDADIAAIPYKSSQLEMRVGTRACKTFDTTC